MSRLIGLCGLAGSGKSTAGEFLVKNSNFVALALADPLKRIAREVYDFTDEQLWGPSSERNKPDKRYPRGVRRYAYPETPSGAAWLPLSNGRGFALVDAEVLPQLVDRPWRLSEKEEGKKTSYVRGAPEVGMDVKLHAFLVGGVPEGHVVDHINGDGLDNRRVNLRVCTVAENRRNESKRLSDSASSPFKGVSWDESRKKWSAKITVKGETKNLGRFDDEGMAALAYDTAARDAFGAFARLNTEMFLTPRYALQTLGTEYGRNCYPNTWIDLAIRTATALRTSGVLRSLHYRYSQKEGLVSGNTPFGPRIGGVAITDVRFLNEVLAINNAGGEVYLLTRGLGLDGAAGQHKSETEMKSIPKELFKGTIDNNEWSLDQLEYFINRIS